MCGNNHWLLCQTWPGQYNGFLARGPKSHLWHPVISSPVIQQTDGRATDRCFSLIGARQRGVLMVTNRTSVPLARDQFVLIWQGFNITSSDYFHTSPTNISFIPHYTFKSILAAQEFLVPTAYPITIYLLIQFILMLYNPSNCLTTPNDVLRPSAVVALIQAFASSVTLPSRDKNLFKFKFKSQ